MPISSRTEMAMVLNKIAAIFGLIFLVGSIQGPKPPIVKVRVAEPSIAQESWDYDLRCTKSIGLEPSRGGNLQDVKWYIAVFPHNKSGYYLGEYDWPDTVVLDTRVTGQFDVVAHELLHHLLHVSPNDAEPDTGHPYVPFYTPCKLMLSQVADFDTATGIVTFRRNGSKLLPRTLDK